MSSDKQKMYLSYSLLMHKMSGSSIKTYHVSSGKQKLYKSTSVPMNLQTDTCISPGNSFNKKISGYIQDTSCVFR